MMKRRKNSSDTGPMMKKAGQVGPKGPAAASLPAAAVAPPPPQSPSVTTAGEVEAKVTMLEWAGGAMGDEQMWWEGQWFPSWDVQVMGEAYISALYSDVWDGYDDDIWGLRNSDRLPSARPTP